MEKSQIKNMLDEFIEACNFSNETDSELFLSNTMYKRYKHLFVNETYKGFKIVKVNDNTWWK